MTPESRKKALARVRGIVDCEFRYGESNVESVANDNRRAIEVVLGVLTELLEDEA